MKAPVKAIPFNLRQVRLLPGPFRDAMLRDKAYLESLNNDRLLHMFQVTAGLPAPGQPYGGWEAPAVEVRGHSLGHYLSACALMVASTGDAKLKAKADAIVAELAKCQAAMPSQGYRKGYLSAFPESFIDRADNLQPVWAPWYTLHKVMAGLLDVFTLTGNAQALEVVTGMAGWVKLRVDRLTEDQFQKALGMEFGGMNDVLANLYGVTGDPEHLRLARAFDHKAVFDPLAKGQDRLTGLHANTQIPKAIGAAREYEVTGEARYHDIASNLWEYVVDGRTFATGGTSDYEHWGPRGKMAGAISVESQETCCTYNMLKLTRHLYGWTADPRLADYYERALFNGILATQHPSNGMFMYYVPMKPGHWKIFSRPADSFWCCVGTGMENHAKYGDSVYFHDADGLFVNLFIASELNWEEKGVRVRQETRFPDATETSLTLACKKPVTMSLRVRIPWWCDGAKLLVNGKAQDVACSPSSYATIARTWKDGDRVTLELPMALSLAPMPDNPNLAAVMYGPLVLAGRLGRSGLTEKMEFVGNQREQHGGPSIPVPILLAEGKPVTDWVKPVPGKTLTFRTTGVGHPDDLELVPFFRLFDERYNVYWALTTRAKWEAAEAQRKGDEARTLDRVAIGDPESEKAHNLRGEKTQSGAYSGRNYRDAQTGGWFSYDLQLKQGVTPLLRVTCVGADAGRRFDLLAGDTLLATVTPGTGGATGFYSVEHPLPAALLEGKSAITVTFRSVGDSMVGGVYGVELLRAE